MPEFEGAGCRCADARMPAGKASASKAQPAKNALKEGDRVKLIIAVPACAWSPSPSYTIPLPSWNLESINQIRVIATSHISHARPTARTPFHGHACVIADERPGGFERAGGRRVAHRHRDRALPRLVGQGEVSAASSPPPLALLRSPYPTRDPRGACVRLFRPTHIPFYLVLSLSLTFSLTPRFAFALSYSVARLPLTSHVCSHDDDDDGYDGYT